MSTKAFGRIRIVRDAKGYHMIDQDESFDLNWWDDAFPENAPHTEHHYYLEDMGRLERLFWYARSFETDGLVGKTSDLIDEFLKEENQRVQDGEE